jgi:hypothetical protein
MSIRALILLLLLSGFSCGAAEETAVDTVVLPSWTVNYDPNLKGDFFIQERFSLPWYIIEHEDGRLENALGGSTHNVKKLLNTAHCTSSFGGNHVIKYAEAWRETNESFSIFIHDVTTTTNDQLLITVRDGRFVAKYWTYPANARKKVEWKVVSAVLVLQKPQVETGKMLRGFVDLQLSGTSPKGGLQACRIRGYIKPRKAAQREKSSGPASP